MFEAIYEVSQLRLNLLKYYESSRILTKHAAHYEAQKLIQMTTELDISLGDESSVLVKLAAALELQLTVLKDVMNFLGGVLNEPNDRLDEQFSDRHFIRYQHASMPKSVALLNYAIELLKKYQFKYYENDWKVPELEESITTLSNILKRGQDTGTFLEQDALKLMHVHNAVLKIAIWHVKYGVLIRCHKDDMTCQH